MVAASLLPITIHKNKLYFLFGKENPKELSAPGWSDFGGRIEGKETPYAAALREGAEELSGFLGSPKQLKSLIKNNGGTMKLFLNNYHIFQYFFVFLIFVIDNMLMGSYQKYYRIIRVL